MRMFNEKLDCKLIALVKNNPVIYDPNDKKYMDFNAREVAWHKIGDELKRPAADCKIRWIHIRDVHRRILRKCIANPGSKQKLYKYHSHLAFMIPFYKEISAQVTEMEEFDEDNDNDNADDNCDTYNDDSKEDADADPTADAASESDEYTDTKPVKRAKKVARTRKNKMVFSGSGIRTKRNKTMFEEKTAEMKEECNVKNVLDDVQPQALFDPKDPVDVFLLNIGATLKSFSAYHLNLAKSKIFSVVQEHEMQQIVEAQPNQCETKVSPSNHDHLYSC